MKKYDLMKDIIQIKEKSIRAQLSVTVEPIDTTGFIGHIPSFDIPFTSPSEDKAREMARGLIKALFAKRLTMGGIDLFEQKLTENKFYKSPSHLTYEHVVTTKSFQIQEEFDVV